MRHEAVRRPDFVAVELRSAKGGYRVGTMIDGGHWEQMTMVQQINYTIDLLKDHTRKIRDAERSAEQRIPTPSGQHGRRPNDRPVRASIPLAGQHVEDAIRGLEAHSISYDTWAQYAVRERNLHVRGEGTPVRGEAMDAPSDMELQRGVGEIHGDGG